VSRSRTTPLGAVIKGLVAGAIGTAVMTAYQLAAGQAMGSGPSNVPGEVGKRVLEGVFQREVSDEQVEQLTNPVHVIYGVSWGPLYGIVQSSLSRGSGRHGLAFGTAVWGASLVQLPAMKLAPPVWEMSPSSIALDLSYHLVYGIGVAAAYAAIDR
jgi:Predicted periplasmic/secreted protein